MNEDRFPGFSVGAIRGVTRAPHHIVDFVAPTYVFRVYDYARRWQFMMEITAPDQDVALGWFLHYLDNDPELQTRFPVQDRVVQLAFTLYYAQ